jgi:hypothetical protein
MWETASADSGGQSRENGATAERRNGRTAQRPNGATAERRNHLTGFAAVPSSFRETTVIRMRRLPWRPLPLRTPPLRS